ncbi:hypothetical protein LTR78_003598 [Recurvomyces mirabilis]|uniref:RRM domain-containing protein n=1 Tax=Recurvomyces mirabilis TaxID=574656 RepID=A0AAE0WRI9_9PEZI|nr:hypothetical protein LTR78_003598 [Recurvomyces mirabilis]KAK5154713.1 hypothetical protein LTS14_006292 [Recurvomyces mirabilis]
MSESTPVQGNNTPDAKQEGGVSLSASVNTTSSDSSPKLSANASPFRPEMPITPLAILSRHSDSDDDQPGPLIVSSNSSVGRDTPNGDKGKGRVDAVVQQPIGTRGPNVAPAPVHVHFTTDIGPGLSFPGSHYLEVKVPISDLDGLSKIMTDLSTEEKMLGMKVESGGGNFELTYGICFDHVEHTDEFHYYIQHSYPAWTSRYISQADYAKMPENRTAPVDSNHFDGQIIMVATFQGPTDGFKNDEAVKTARDFAAGFGTVKAFMPLTKAWPNIEFRVEYHKISDAKKALDTASKEAAKVVGSYKLFVKEMMLANATTGEGVAGPSHYRENSPTSHGFVSGNGQHISETGRTTWSLDDNGVPQAGKPMRVVPKVDGAASGPLIVSTPQRDRFHSTPQPNTPQGMMYGTMMPPRSGSWNGPLQFRSPDEQHVSTPQQVEVWRIGNGTDVRTTVMLRNVPNRMTFGELKNYIDFTSKGKYDFLYLRIDFEKNTNVGYAFIDFANPEDILEFLTHRNGTRWSQSNGRVVHLSYATIQGYDCLVEKFRNSAIMLENPEYRPKLYYTSETAPEPSKVGEQREFPGPNNVAKQQRSIQNASEMGLYTPHGNRMHRDRGRRSQYDRGTPAQLQEEMFYHGTPMQQGQLTYAGYGNTNNAYASPHQYGNQHGFQNNGYPVHGFMNGHPGNCYAFTPRMAGPPPFFPQMGGYHEMPPPYLGHPEFQDPFAADPDTGVYGNGYNGNHVMHVGTPGARVYTMTPGGPVQSPGGAMSAVAEVDETGYNEHPGPHHGSMS